MATDEQKSDFAQRMARAKADKASQTAKGPTGEAVSVRVTFAGAGQVSTGRRVPHPETKIECDDAFPKGAIVNLDRTIAEALQARGFVEILGEGDD